MDELEVPRRSLVTLYNGWPLTQKIDPQAVEAVCAYFGCPYEDLIVSLTHLQAKRLHDRIPNLVLRGIGKRKKPKGKKGSI